MKKIIIIALTVVIFTTFIFYTRNEEQFVPVNQSELSTTVPSTTVQNEKKEYVNIVIMSNNYSSIYHSNINLASESLIIYSGKKYQDTKHCKNISISKYSKLFKKSKKIKISATGKICLNGKVKYNGQFYLYKTNSGVVVVNKVDIEDYVAGVISSEMGNDFQVEALKAQAVCARTYIKSCKKSKYKKYNAIADDSTDYQVYNKIEPGESCKLAAQKTSGKVMYYKGKLIRAYYFSTSCGCTTNYKIWGKEKRKYLKGTSLCDFDYTFSNKNDKSFESFIKKKKKSLESDYPFYRWKTYMSNESIMYSVYNSTGVDVGKIEKIEVNERETGGIASQITVYGEKRQVIINNQNQIRKVLCSYYAEIKLNDNTTRTHMEMLPSAFIFIEKKGDGFQIYGGGFGHGSGLSQNGANEMAKKGSNYVEILNKFYNGIKISEDI